MLLTCLLLQCHLCSHHMNIPVYFCLLVFSVEDFSEFLLITYNYDQVNNKKEKKISFISCDAWVACLVLLTYPRMFIDDSKKCTSIANNTKHNYRIIKVHNRKIHYLKKKKRLFKMLWQYSCHDSIMPLTNTEPTCALKLSERSKRKLNGELP